MQIISFFSILLSNGSSCLKSVLCSFLRPSLSRWMRRIRPTLWCLWLLCLKSPSISRLQMGSPHQKTETTLHPPPMDTPLTRPKWLTLRCDPPHFYQSFFCLQLSPLCRMRRTTISACNVKSLGTLAFLGVRKWLLRLTV